jgi:2-haloacid dehalogenase
LLEHSVSLDQPSIDSLMHAYDSLSTFPDVEPALNMLSSNDGIDCVVFSNGTREMVSNSVNKSPDLSQHASIFKKLVSVDFIQSFKPMPEVYKYLAQTGNPFDVTGARAVGMQAAWVDRAGKGWQDQLSLEPTVVVRSLEQITAVIEEYARKTLKQ